MLEFGSRLCVTTLTHVVGLVRVLELIGEEIKRLPHNRLGI